MIIIDFEKNIPRNYIQHFTQKFRYSYKYTYNIKANFSSALEAKLKIKQIDKIIISQTKKDTLKISFSNKDKLKIIYFLVNKKRLILKIINIKQTKKTRYEKIYKSKIIVIDPGHGGKDSGAVGAKHRYEKIVVFKISKYLESILKKRGYKVYLTRYSDKFLKVRNRTVLANKKKAHIFLSIHANAAIKSKVKKANGIETFFLSPARSKRAKRIAAIENKSDMRKMNYSSKNTLLTILNQSKITASNKLAIDIHTHMLNSTRKLYKNVTDGGVREGPFWVLVGAQMPSVLLEVGYITHLVEGKRLSESNYKKQLAIGIANGVDQYFQNNP